MAGKPTQDLPAFTTALIVGGGPVGLFTALLLAHYGYDSVIVERWPSRLGQPKAHVINPRTLEIFRQAGVDIAALRLNGLTPEEAGAVRFVSSVTGIEFGHIDLSDRTDEDYIGGMTPEPMFNIAQPLLEEYLIHKALSTGKVTFYGGLEWKGCVEDVNHEMKSELRAHRTDEMRLIKSRYVIGCDGAGSKSRDVFGIPFEPLNRGPERELHYVSVHFSADLTYIKPAVLWFVLEPKGMGVFIAYNRKNSWVYFRGYDPARTPKETFTTAYMQDQVFKAFGKPLPDYKDLGITIWKTTPKLAKTYRSPLFPRAFLAGDAAHTFPPTGGLGVNTGIADVQNICWKIHAVEQGWADEAILDTITTERLPVAHDNCKQSRLNEIKIFKLIEIFGSGTPVEQLWNDPKFRANAQKAIDENVDHFQSINLQIGYVYGRDHIRGASDYQKEATPGARLPHIWLRTKSRKISSLDLIDGLSFVMIASANFCEDHQIDIQGIPVSIKQLGRDFDDPTGDFGSLFNLRDRNAVLVRPDQHIAGNITSIQQAEELLGFFRQKLSNTAATAQSKILF